MLSEACTVFGPIGRSMTDMEGDDALNNECWCISWKYGLCANNLIRLLTGNPNWEEGEILRENVYATRREKWGGDIKDETRTHCLCWMSSSL